MTQLDELRKRVTAIGKLTIRVGVFGANASRAHPSGGGSVGEIAIRNHYGAPGVPARPFLTYALRKHRRAIQETFRGVVASGATPEQVGELVGAFAAGAVQETISDRIPPPNAPATVAAKGSDVPLIDSGILRQSISYEVTK